ncbi:hypothetical protein BBK14_18835 [Parafrankia soli]|uniref:IclR family transcriptional regulator n=1 Tax=Parafrankia soli TaxID=2599596 RepID=A0A1S1PYV9_9ACTN|nr:IclR family transcriptional regulator C-terminal domain-containing protein [Parafrankia soli]OHV27848.1 hypothetical protein BBK14_18835 [Parafrankia soli]
MDDHTVTGRVVAVLDAVAAGNGAVTLAELTRSTGIPKPTVRRITADLVARHLLERGDNGFRLGCRLLELGTRAAAHHGLRHIATPYVQDLFARSGEIVWVMALARNSVAIIDHVFGANRAQDMRRGSWSMDVHSPAFLTTAAGRILLADRPDLAARLRGRRLPPLTRRTVTSWPRIAADIAAVRDTGTAVEHEQCSLGHSCVAAGLRGRDGSLVGVIGITGRTATLAAPRLTRPLAAAAADLSRELATSAGCS